MPEKAESYTARDLLLRSAEYLTSHGVPHARREAEWLVAEIMGCGRLDVYLRYEETVSDAARTRLREMIMRRGKREPLAYVIGHMPFMDLSIEVTLDVLVPRPETEILVETATERFPADAKISIADVGTGSGCIACALLESFPNAELTATDISEKALAVAKRNLEKLNLASRVKLLRADLLPEGAGQFDLVMANLPYVSESDYEKVEPEVKAEPKVALVPGPTGLELISKLIARVPAFLAPGGWLLLEIGYNQSSKVKSLLEEAGMQNVFIEEDFAGLPRVAGGSKQA